jgi:hypothetical protein
MAEEVISIDELEAMESVAPSPAQQQEIERENRRKIAVESPLDPNSLCGSWALCYGGAKVLQALIVAEVYAGTFLLEFYDVVTDSPAEQRLVKIEDLTKLDDDGSQWMFFDDRASVRAAFRGMLA